MQNYTEVLREMKALRQEWSDNYFVWETEKKERYDLLKQVRWARIKQMYADGMVYKGTGAQSSAH